MANISLRSELVLVELGAQEAGIQMHIEFVLSGGQLFDWSIFAALIKRSHAVSSSVDRFFLNTDELHHAFMLDLRTSY